MNVEQYKKKMNCVKTKFEYIGKQSVFDWYVDWKRGIVLASVTDDESPEGRICHTFEYRAGADPKFNEYNSVEEYTTEVKRLDSW